LIDGTLTFELLKIRPKLLQMKQQIYYSKLLFFIFLFSISTHSFAQKAANNLVQEYLEKQKPELLTRSNSIKYRIGADLTEKQTEIRRIYAQQQVNGIDVKDAIIGLHFSPNGQKAI
jgi:Zn-dependent metalloprotease